MVSSIIRQNREWYKETRCKAVWNKITRGNYMKLSTTSGKKLRRDLVSINVFCMIDFLIIKKFIPKLIYFRYVYFKQAQKAQYTLLSPTINTYCACR